MNPEEIAIDCIPTQIEDKLIRIIIPNDKIDKLIEDIKIYKKGVDKNEF